jgi:outer membrane lipopolysaccharide assembly protein LptE/RlpB
MRLEKLALLLLISVSMAGCGYRLAARKGDVGAGQTIGVPTFTNSSTTYRLEQRMSEAVRKELARSTHYKVSSSDNGDVVVRGEVLDYVTNPTVVDASGRGSQYAVGIVLKVSVTERATGKTLLQNNSMVLRDTFQLSPNAGDFVPEDPAAVERMGSRFAEAVVTALLRR